MTDPTGRPSRRSRLTTWVRYRGRRTGQSAVPVALLLIALLGLATAGRLLTHQLFFADLRLDDLVLADDRQHFSQTFKYDGVAWFDGIVADSDFTVLRLTSTQLLDAAEHKGLECFVRLDVDETRDGSAGRLRIDQVLPLPADADDAERRVITHRLDLAITPLQRFTIPWTTEATGVNKIRVRFEPAADAPVSMATAAFTVVNATWWGRLTVWTLIGLAALIGRLAWSRWSSLRFTLLVSGVIVPVVALVHSGALISNAYITEADGSVRRLAPRVNHIVEHGELPNTMYRGVGYAAVPLLTMAIEGQAVVTSHSSHYYDTFPTARYLMFVWFTVSLIILLRATWVTLGGWTTVALGLVAGVFYPFIHDLYHLEDDATLIPLMLVLTSFVLRDASAEPRTMRWIVGISVVLFLMLLTKVTALVLVPLIPLGLGLRAWRERRSDLLGKALTALGALLLAATLGRTLARPINPEVAPGVAYADSVLWEVIWAANGYHDDDTAHGFTKDGPERSRRVAARTGLPDDRAHYRHSQLATDEVYRPDVQRALRERPGVFWSNAFVRAYHDGVHFWRYPYDSHDRFEAFRPSDHGRPAPHELELIRHDRHWKIAPLVFVTKITQFELTLLTDLALMLAALVGVLATRRWEIIVLGIGCLATNVSFGAMLHFLVRYTDFTNVPLLLGLAVLLVLVGRVIRDAARRYDPAADSTP